MGVSPWLEERQIPINLFPHLGERVSRQMTETGEGSLSFRHGLSQLSHIARRAAPRTEHFPSPIG